MTDPHSTDSLIAALGWLAVEVALAVLLFAHFGATLMLRRWTGAPDLAWATLGAVLTAIGAAWAALTLAVPGRSRAWAWLPLPGAVLCCGAAPVASR